VLSYFSQEPHSDYLRIAVSLEMAPFQEASVSVPKAPITRSADVLGGTPVFAGTRVPIQTLWEYLEEGTLDEFLGDFPTVTRTHALAVLNLARDSVLAKVTAA
jgi:uncharacterized protein (DUF433 family)